MTSIQNNRSILKDNIETYLAVPVNKTSPYKKIIALYFTTIPVIRERFLYPAIIKYNEGGDGGIKGDDN